MFLVLFYFILVEISEIRLVGDRRTDLTSYRDARTHLKIMIGGPLMFIVLDERELKAAQVHGIFTVRNISCNYCY